MKDIFVSMSLKFDTADTENESSIDLGFTLINTDIEGITDGFKSEQRDKNILTKTN